MKTVFDLITRTALRFRGLTLILVVLVSVLGISAGTQLQQELLPPVEFPQTIILAQVSGMESEEVLEVVTKRIEAELTSIEEIVNLESTTTSAIGALIIAANDFGLDQEALRDEIQDSLDQVWFPQREISPADGVTSAEFADQLLGDITPDMMLYLADNSPNFIFQLLPDTWARLSDDTVLATLSYLADQVTDTASDKTALERLVEQEVVPQLRALQLVANVQVNGGQALPSEGVEQQETETVTEVRSLLYQLSDDVWDQISSRFDAYSDRNDETIVALIETGYVIPDKAPPLPASWVAPHFTDMSDIIELASATRSTSDLLNNLPDTGILRGSLGRTDDLTPEVVERMLALAPSLVNYFNADQLASMSPDVFAVLPEDFISQLDGFTRDELAAVAIAQSLTGEDATREPVLLPNAWRIAPPQIITFSFSDIPLATFSVFGDAPIANIDGAIADVADESATNETSNSASNSVPNDALPEGPALPQIFTLIGDLFGAELNTADDLAVIQPSGVLAEAFGDGAIRGADFFNLLLQFNQFASAPAGTTDDGVQGLGDFDIASFIPALSECGIGILDIDPTNFDIAGVVIGCMPADAFAFLADNDDTFVASLQAGVYEYLSPEILALDGVSPPLGDVWSTLVEQPQFTDMPLRNADDVVALGQGSPASFLNQLNDSVPDRFAGYEIRLFDSLTNATISYFVAAEPDFYNNLDTEVLLELSPSVLANIPTDIRPSLDEDVLAQAEAIASGEVPSAAAELQTLYTTDVTPTDPDAPALGPTWQTIVQFISGVDALDNASDFLRFPDAIGSPAGFINSFLRGQGAGLAPDLIGELTPEVLAYIAERDATFLASLEPQALLLLNEDALASLPQAIQNKASAGEVFIPATQVTRTNGASSLLVTVYKDAEANTVEAYYQISEVIDRINEDNDNIEIFVAFEQSSFVETSITGVIREGSLGAFFAIINILVFLSGGFWGVGGRRIVGFITLIIFIGLLAALIFVNLDAANGDIGGAFSIADTVLRIIAILGIISGLFIMFYPGSLPYPSWRSTLVIGVSIPLSILSALALMRWFPLTDGLTLNIMTLSGLTVAVGRVVDDSIVVLENIFRQIQTGMDKREAILSGVRDVSVAIFSATSIAVVVFLPLGLTGGIIGEFFLPFGLAVTYALISSFIVAITVIPALAYYFISADDVPEETETWMQKLYVPTLKITLHNNFTRWGVVIIAILSAGFGAYLFGTRPAAFLPDFGEPRISVAVSMPQDYDIIQTNELVLQMESDIVGIVGEENISTISTTVGGGGLGFEALFGGGGVNENQANIEISVVSQDSLDTFTVGLRTRAEELFGEDNVTVSAGTIASGGFGGFELVVSGEDQSILEQYDAQVIQALNDVDGITNVSSNLSEAATAGANSATFIRSNQSPAASYTGELETDDTIGITDVAIEAILTNVAFPDGVTVRQGFDSEVQTAGFEGVFVAMGIAIVIVIAILVLVFGSPIYWLAVIFSIIVAPVGAAVALSLTDRVLGISALIGLLMLLGLVVTNAVVLIDRVGSNRSERGMNLNDALLEAGSRRVRPILMTALATIIALVPLAVGLSDGAIIASELGTVVIGGVLSSTLLTLIVTPAAYYLFTPLHDGFMRLIGRS